MLPPNSKRINLETAFQLLLLALIATGLFMRFNWVNWSQGANLHPDEYGLTNTLTQLSIPESPADYFNTRLSPMSPYAKYDEQGLKLRDGPDNGMRWGQLPMYIIRLAAEVTGNTGYDELRLTGRSLSALADAFSLLLLFLIGRRLYNRTVALLATALSALAVLQIQQSHFMTVDNFAVTFAMLALYACVRIAGLPPAQRSGTAGSYSPDFRVLGWYALFGAALGATLASKINLLPLAGLVLVGGFIGLADLKLKRQADIRRIVLIWAGFTLAAFVIAALTFRVAQPMSFRQETGNTGLFEFSPNPDWLANMKAASTESSGVGGGPPAEQWAHRPAIIFPLVNMLLYGLGLPLGVMAWVGFFWAAWRALRFGDHWRAHLIPLVWTGGYFFFMATRWVKSIRYFLPVYPFLALLAAWALVRLWQRARAYPQRRALKTALASLAAAVVIGGSLAWSVMFVNAVYRTDHTRVQATRWMFENIPAAVHLELQSEAGVVFHQPLGVPSSIVLVENSPVVLPFSVRQAGRLSGVTLPHADPAVGEGSLRLEVALDEGGTQKLDEAVARLIPGQEARAQFSGAALSPGTTYYLRLTNTSAQPVSVRRNVLANESWDEGLPFPFDGYDPFGQLYSGVTLEARWYDTPEKRQMFLAALQQADYLILPSQRAIWTTCRLPRTYPMTMSYYRALFDGRLGFEQVAAFSAPLKLGPLYVSDVAGRVSWGQPPALPLFLRSQLSAEEAFSVYDHPPVWIFKKTAGYNQAAVEQFFNSIDISGMVVQNAKNADGAWCE